jgi:hypothetical protein
MAGYGDDSALRHGWRPMATACPLVRRRMPCFSSAAAHISTEPTGSAFPASRPVALLRNGLGRAPVLLYGSTLANDVVPQRVMDASYMAAYIEATSPGSLSVIVDPSRRVKRQKVDTIEREFFEPGKSDYGLLAGPASSAIEGLLAPLLMAGSFEPAILVV